MAKITLNEYSKGKSRAEIAREIGVSRAAVSQMLDGDREIYIETDDLGQVTAWEKREIPARKSSAA